MAARADDVALDWSPDLRYVTISQQGTLPAIVSRLNLDTGERTKIFEVAPANLTGVLGVFTNAFRDNGRDYAYSYVKIVSTLYLVNGLR